MTDEELKAIAASNLQAIQALTESVRELRSGVAASSARVPVVTVSPLASAPSSKMTLLLYSSIDRTHQSPVATIEY